MVPTRAPSDPGSYPTPGAADDGDSVVEVEEGFPAGWRLGGIILLLNAGLVLAEISLSSADNSGSMFVGSAVVDLILGGMLVAGKASVRKFALLRSVLGAILFPIIHLATGQPFLVVFQLAISSALILLLTGRPGTARMVVGSTIAGLYFLVSVSGLFVLIGGANPAAGVLWAMQGELEGDELGGAIRGNGGTYLVEVPDDAGWYHRDTEKRHRDNELADLWLVRPDVDAHVIVILELVEGDGEVILERLIDVVVGNLESLAPDLEVVDSRPIRGNPAGSLIEIKATVDGLPIQYWFGIYADGPWAVQVVTFVSQTQASKIGPSLEKCASSFRWE